jgi:hypothetical protein
VRGARLLFKQVNLNGGHARLPCEIEDGKFACACPINGLRLLKDMTATQAQNYRLDYGRVSNYGRPSMPSLSSCAPPDAPTGTSIVIR